MSSNLGKRLDQLERALTIPARPPTIYSWHGGHSSEKPAFFDEYEWLYTPASCTGVADSYICAAHKPLTDETRARLIAERQQAGGPVAERIQEILDRARARRDADQDGHT